MILTGFAVSSCAPEQQVPAHIPSGDSFFVSFEMPDAPETRVFADADHHVFWNADDRISVFNRSTDNLQYRFTGETGAASGSFAPVPGMSPSEGGQALDLVYAVYPYQGSTRAAGDGVLTVILPAMQAYRDSSFGPGASTMVSVATDNNLQLKNLCGFFSVRLYGDDVSISSVTLQGHHAEHLAGKVSVTAQSGTAPTLAFVASEAADAVTLTCDPPVRIGTAPQTATPFWFVIPPTLFTEGFTLSVRDAEYGLYEKSTSTPLEIRRNTLKNSAPLHICPAPTPELISFSYTGLTGILAASFDTNGDGRLSYEEAAAVTSGTAIKNAISGNKSFTSFDEFRFFTGVKAIVDMTFQNCSNMVSITIPKDVTYIGASAFLNCSALQSIALPRHVTEIAPGAFTGCSSLSSITIPSGVAEIGLEAFMYCSALTGIDLPSGLLYIDNKTFSHCSSLKTLDIPDGVFVIGHSAFEDCSSLTSVTLPEGLTHLSHSAFLNCSSLSSVTLPDGISVLNKKTFYGCTSLSSVELPAALTGIGDEAFRSCRSLATISIPETVDSIGIRAFYDCRGLTSVTLPGSITEIPDEMFYACLALNSATIPGKVGTIGNSAFFNCQALTAVTLPPSVGKIGRNAFYNCRRLTAIHVQAATPPTGNSGMFDRTNDCPIYVPAASVAAYKAAPYWSAYANRIQAETD